MANQNPQPEIYTTRHSFASGVAAGTQNIKTVYTNQNSSEEVRIYSLSVNCVNSGTGAASTATDFSVRIKIGNSYVPFQEFDLGVIQARDDRTVTFPTPILVLFQQPISVEVNWKGGTGQATTLDPATDVKVSLNAELSLAEVCLPNGQMGFPREIDQAIPRRSA